MNIERPPIMIGLRQTIRRFLSSLPEQQIFGSAKACIAAMLPLRAASKCMGRDLSERAYWAQVLQWVKRRTRNREDAEDLLHSAYERLARYRAEASQPVHNPAAFLVTTASRIAIDDHRRSQIWAHEDLRHAESRADHVPLQDEVVAARARLHRVTEGMAKLSPRTREVFLMHRLDGLKYREIATRLGITESAVEKHIAKAMLFLTAWAQGW